jgi:hypothetical protein
MNNQPALQVCPITGAKEWRLPTGELHRTDGPAYMHVDHDGSSDRSYVEGEEQAAGYAYVPKNTILIWYQHGKVHRTDGPAKMFDDMNCWYHDGHLHRPDRLPHYEYKNGSLQWYVDDHVMYTQEKYNAYLDNAVQQQFEADHADIAAIMP